MDELYKIEVKPRIYKTPDIPKPENYYDISETKEEREERIWLYSEVKEDE